ncbi:MAG TPA: hypothetical protein VL336_02095 [Sphingomicrobium sp.]|jgi:hypothetical protein|nr:hypothetical protein [Sphingomicrobium sp.]
MIHFIPESPETAQEIGSAEALGPYAEAVARLASIRQALACVEQFAGGEVSDSMAEAKLAAGWPNASPAKQRVFNTRSAKIAAAAAAGLEMIANGQENGNEPHPAAIERLKRELGDGIGAIDQLFSL